MRAPVSRSRPLSLVLPGFANRGVGKETRHQPERAAEKLRESTETEQTSTRVALPPRDAAPVQRDS
jgi:hypothetical protein